MRRAERQRSQEGEQKNGGGGQRGDIDRTVLPQFAPHRPVHAPTGGDDRRRGYLRFEGRPGLGVLWSTHRVPPLAAPLLLLITATNKSGMLGVRTSPNAASCWRSPRSNSRI